MTIPPLTHLLFEVGAYALFVVCLAHALGDKERRRERLSILLTGTVYGVLLETMTIYQLHAYVYGPFLVMFNGEVPLVIGVGWGIILYSAIGIANRFRLSLPAWIATVGLVGLAIDATMDVAAVRTGMWNWFSAGGGGQFLAAGQEWFGVAFGNYFAWFVVLTSAAGFLQWFQPGAARRVWGSALRCLAALAASVVVLAGLDALYVQIAPGQWWPIAVEGGLALLLIIVSRLRASGGCRDGSATLGLPAQLVPLFFHLFFAGILIWAWIDPAIIERPELRAAYPAQVPVLLGLALAFTLLTAGLIWLARRPPAASATFAERYGPWAVVAGASVGLGAAFASALAQRGCKLLLVARRPDALETLAAELRRDFGAEVECLAADLADPDCAPRIQAALAGRALGLAVYNAAHAPMGSFIGREPADLEKVAAVNVRGPLLFARALLPGMAQQGHGGLILMSSMAGTQGSPRLAAYAASKAFNRVLAEGLWHEMKGSGVDVLACVAGAIRTPGYLDSAAGDAPGTLDPSQVAEQAIAALGHGPVVVTGLVNRIASVLMGRLLPRRLAIALMAQNTADLEPNNISRKQQ